MNPVEVPGPRAGKQMALVGRRDEQEALDRLLDGARSGRSGVLVVRGEAGSARQRLLEQLVEQASGCKLARATGVQADMELAVRRAAADVWLDARLARALPRSAAQGVAEVAFGLRSGPAPDRFEVGLAILGLLARSPSKPLVCVVDDAQWLDQASALTLAFVARRLVAESVALVFAVRDPAEEQTFAGLPELIVGGLSDEDARRVLGLAIAGRVDERVIERIVAETRGNPLALLELPRGLSAAELAGGFGVSSTQPVSARLEQSSSDGSGRCPAATQRFLLLAAAEPGGRPGAADAGGGAGRAGRRSGRASGGGGLDRARRSRSGFITRSCARRSTRRAARRQAGGPPRAGRGDRSAGGPDRRAWHRAQARSVPTRISLPSWSARPSGRRRAAGWRQRRRSSSARRR